MHADEIVETEIAVSRLQRGMHVVRLDRPWAGTNFPLQGFIIKTDEDIHALRAQCHTVFIEGRISFHDPLPRHLIPSQQASPPQPVRQVSYINRIPLEDEMRGARAHFRRSRKAAQHILNSVRLGRVLDLNAIRPVVRGVVNSILRNDAARSSKQALDIIYKAAGTQYDRTLALELVRFIGIYPPGALVEMSSGEIGIVLESFTTNRLRPKVLVVRDRDKQPCQEEIRNLMELHVVNGEALKVTREWPSGSFDVELKDYLNRGLPLSMPPQPGQ